MLFQIKVIVAIGLSIEVTVLSNFLRMKNISIIRITIMNTKQRNRLVSTE